jgi:hypothetical protein
MGILRLCGRDAVRLSSKAREREGRLASRHSREIAQCPVVVAAPSMDIVAMSGLRHSAADRTRVRRVPSEGKGRPVS